MNKFKNISNKPGFMKHNGGLMFREISKKKFQFKTTVRKINLNRAGITHGGFLSGIIDAGVLVNISESNINELMQSLKDKEFTNVRKWIVHNLDNDAVRIFRRVYDSLYDYMDGSTIPHVVVILAEYQYKASFVSDQEINLLACMTEIMGQAKFK